MSDDLAGYHEFQELRPKAKAVPTTEDEDQ